MLLKSQGVRGSKYPSLRVRPSLRLVSCRIFKDTPAAGYPPPRPAVEIHTRRVSLLYPALVSTLRGLKCGIWLLVEERKNKRFKHEPQRWETEKHSNLRPQILEIASLESDMEVERSLHSSGADLSFKVTPRSEVHQPTPIPRDLSRANRPPVSAHLGLPSSRLAVRTPFHP